MEIEILAFGAHPDDVECAAAGVILSVAALGGKVVIADLSKGEMGSFGDEFSRKKESIAASALLGLFDRVQLNMPDGAIENTPENRLQLISLIRHYRPKIILCNASHDRHPDHKRASALVSEAAYLSGLKKMRTDSHGFSQQQWRPAAVYHYIQDLLIEPSFVVDISDYFEKKMEVIRSYQSQFITSGDYVPNGSMALLKQIESTNSIFGRGINVAYAEGFTKESYVGIKNILDLV